MYIIYSSTHVSTQLYFTMHYYSVVVGILLYYCIRQRERERERDHSILSVVLLFLYLLFKHFLSLSHITVMRNICK